MHVVARCNNRKFYFTTPEDFEVLLANLRELVPTYETLGRPPCWFMTETTKAFHKARDLRGHFWERRYRSCLIEDGTYALAALWCLDRNPVNAGLVNDPLTYQWLSCATYFLGTPNRMITLHPSYFALSPYPKVRQRQYDALLAPSEDPRADARDPCWSTQRAVGSPAFVAPFAPRRRGRPRSGTRPSQNQEVRP